MSDKPKVVEKLLKYGKDKLNKDVVGDFIGDIVTDCISHVIDKEINVEHKSDDEELNKYKEIIQIYSSKIIDLETQLLQEEDEEIKNKLRSQINENYTEMNRVKLTKQTLEENYISSNELKHSENKISAKYAIGIGAPLLFAGGVGLACALKTKTSLANDAITFDEHEEEMITEMSDENI